MQGAVGSGISRKQRQPLPNRAGVPWGDVTVTCDSYGATWRRWGLRIEPNNDGNRNGSLVTLLELLDQALPEARAKPNLLCIMSQ